MPFKYLYILVFFAFNAAQAQNEYNVWYFGQGAGLNFNSKPPLPLNNGKMWAFESSTSICDSNGNLRFYTDGDSLFNRQHKLMLNWKSARPYAWIESAAQGSMALPVPGKPGMYFAINGLSNEAVNNYKDSMIRYKIIDMKGDGGLGSVVLNDQDLINAGAENFAVTLCANGSDYWIGSFDGKGHFFSRRTYAGAFTAAQMQQNVSKPVFFYKRCSKFSPDSRILSGNSYYTYQYNVYQHHTNLYRFDNASGLLSNAIALPLSITQTEFSANSQYVYHITFEGFDWHLQQFDLSIWDSVAIMASQKTIFTINTQDPDYANFSGMQLGPDRKIYVLHNNSNKISVLHNPDLPGLSSNFNYKSIDLGNVNNQNGGPYFPTFWFQSASSLLGNDTLICSGDSLTLHCKAMPGSRLLWSTGDSSAQIIVKTPGMYSLIATAPNGFKRYDTLMLKTGPKFKVFIGNDTSFCHRFSHIIKASAGFNTYKWNNGSENMQITVNSKGIYSVKTLDSNACASGDTIAIDRLLKPLIKLNYDSTNCRFVYLSADSIKGLRYVWNTGETGSTIQVRKTGWYKLTQSNTFCSNADSIQVLQLPMPQVNLGPDTSLCSNRLLLKTFETGNYLWNTLETRPSILADKAGIYWLSVSRNNCTASDTIVLYACQDILYAIPDAFSPNGDGINDVFRVFGSNIEHIEMFVYNRWGELLLNTSGKDAAWDGSFKHLLCPESVYFYTILLKGKRAGNQITLKGSITLLR